MTFRSGVASASLLSVVVVNSKFDSLGVGIIGNPLDSVRETVRICLEFSVFITFVRHPAIINVNHLPK